MLEDKKGFIWLAGNKCLFRYDGKTFKTFTHPEKRSRSLFNLKLDSEGRVWCNNFAGQFFYALDESLYLFDDYSKKTKGQLADYLFFDDQLIIRINDVKLSVDLKTKNKKRLPIENFGTDGGVISSNDVFLTLTENFNLGLYDKAYQLKKTFQVPILEADKPKLGFTSYFKDEDASYVVFQSKNGELKYLYSVGNNRVLKVVLPNELKNTVVEHCFIENDTWYFSTSKGVFVAKYNSGVLTSKTHYLKAQYVTNVLRDFNGNLWLSTLKNGLFIVPNENVIIHSKITDINVLEKQTDSTLYIGRQNGELIQFNKNNSAFQAHSLRSKTGVKHLNYNPKTKVLFYNTSDKSLLFNEVLKVTQPIADKITISNEYIQDFIDIIDFYNYNIEFTNEDK